jgi:hypothetical protein
MILRTLPLTLAAVLAVTGPALAAETTLKVEHAAVRLVVIPEARSDISYTVQPGHSGLPAIQARHDGGVLVLDGGLETSPGHSRIRGCDSWGASHVVDDKAVWKLDLGKQVRIDGLGGVKVADLPVITVHVPLDAKIRAGDAVFGEIGPSNSLELANGGCGDWQVADVRGAARFALGGSGDVHAHNLGDAHVSIGGSSNVFVMAASALEAQIGGSGNVRAKTVNGPISANIGGSGNAVVDSGSAPKVTTSVAGSGNFVFKGTAGAVNAAVAGSGNVTVAHATGPVSKSVVGSGNVKIGS